MLAVETAVGDVQGRRVAHLGLAPQLLHVVVDIGNRNGVLDAGVAVDDHAHIELEHRAALGHHHHAGLTRGFEHLLALFATRLLVAFDADRTIRLLALQVGEGVIQTVHLGGHAGFRAIKNRAGRIDARTDDGTRTLQLGTGEDFAIAVRRVMDRREAEGQRGVIDPALLRDQLGLAHAAVPMHIDQAGDDGLAARVELLRVGRDRHLSRRADRRDAVAVDHDHAVVDDFVVRAHRRNACAGDDQLAPGLVGGLVEADLLADFCRLEAGLFVDHRCESLTQGRGEQLIAQRGVDAQAVAAPMQACARIHVELAHRQRVHLGADTDGLSDQGQGRHIGMETFDKAQPLAVRRDGVLGHELAFGDLGLLPVVQVDADQLAAALHLVGDGLAGDVDGIIARTELRRFTGLGQAGRYALAVAGREVDASVQAVPGRGQEAAARLDVSDRFAIRRKTRSQVFARLGRDDGLPAAGQVELSDRA